MAYSVLKGTIMTKGIDLSRWNGDINWPQVAQDGKIKFAFTKATEGETFQDPKFEENFRGMRDNDINAGAYHVFRMTSTPNGQFGNITNTLEKANFSPSIDKLAVSATTGICSQEQTEKCDDPTKHTNQQRAENLHDLLTKLDGAGYRPIIYASPATWDQYYTQENYNFSDRPLWVADWTEAQEPKIPQDWKNAEKSYDYWNYTNKGRIAGIEGEVCLDRTRSEAIIGQISQNLGEIKENFFSLSSNFENLENVFNQVSQAWIQY